VLFQSVAMFVGMLCVHHQDVIPITLGHVCPFNQFDLPLWVAVLACSGDNSSSNDGGDGGGNGSCNDSGGSGSSNDDSNNNDSDDGGCGGSDYDSGSNSNSDSDSDSEGSCGGGGGGNNNSKVARMEATMVAVVATAMLAARTKMMATAT
jgi:hypothetical protein